MCECGSQLITKKYSVSTAREAGQLCSLSIIVVAASNLQEIVVFS